MQLPAASLFKSGNNPEEISVLQSDTALPRDFFSKFYFDLKMPKMVFKQGYLSISNCHLPNEEPFYSSKCPFFQPKCLIYNEENLHNSQHQDCFETFLFTRLIIASSTILCRRWADHTRIRVIQVYHVKLYFLFDWQVMVRVSCINLHYLYPTRSKIELLEKFK